MNKTIYLVNRSMQHTSAYAAWIYLVNRSMQHTSAYAAWMISIILMFLFLPEAKAGTQSQFDQAEWPDGAPYVSPYALKANYGAKPMVKLAKVGYFEPRYFQFIVSEENGGNKALTMVWKKETVISGETIKAHYELALEDLENTEEDQGPENIGPKRVRLDRTLWKVRARRDPNSSVLYYTLINKASQLPLQLSEKEDAPIPVEIVDGSTDWLWSDAAEAVSGSKFDNTVTQVLQGPIRAAINTTTTLYLVKSGDDVAVKFINSISDVPDNAITFEAWEANPIILTAEQINTKLGYEDITTQNKGTKDLFKFTFSPDVEGLNATNVMTSYTFKAEAPKPVVERVAGDPIDGYVRFQALDGDKETGKYLMVDTAYYDPESNDKFDLQMAVKTVEYPEYAVLKDGLTVKDGVLYDADGKEVKEGVPCRPNIVLAQLKRQTNFKPIFYPSTQSLRLQAEMIFKADKKGLKNNNPWWAQMVELTGGIPGTAMIIANAYDNTMYKGPGYYEPYNKGNDELLKWGTTGTDWRAVATPAIGAYSFDDWKSGVDGAFSFAYKAFNNVVKLITLTSDPKHTVLTCDIRDVDDERNVAGYDGLLTYISLEGLVSADHLEPLTLPNDASTITISYADDVWSYKDDEADAVGFNGTIKIPDTDSSTDKLVITGVTGNPTLIFNNVRLEPTDGTALTINDGCELTLQGHLTIDIAEPTDGNTYYCINNSGTLTVALTNMKSRIELHCYGTAINNTGTLHNAWIEWQFASALGESGGIEITSNNDLDFQSSHENKTFAMPVIAGNTYKFKAKKNSSDMVCQQGKAADGTSVIFYPAKNGVAVFTDVKDAVSVSVVQPTNGGSISVFCNDNLLAANDYVPDKATLACRYNALPGYELDTYTATPGTDPSTPSDVSASATYQVPDGATSIVITATFKEKQDPDPAPTVYYAVVIPALEGATTDPAAGTYEVPAWDSFCFYLTLDADYDQSTPIVTTDRGETLKPRTSDGAYLIWYVRSPVKISIAGIQKNVDTANAAIEAGIKIWTEPSALCLETDRTEEVRIVSLNGTTVTFFSAHPGTSRRALAPGAYVVKAGRTVCKVIVR